MNPRCGSHAEIVAGERASIGVGRQGVGICPAEPADTPGDLRPQQRNASGIRGSSCNRYPWRARSPVARSGGQQGPNGRLQMRLQDIHSVTPSVLRRQKVASCPQVTPAEGGAAYTLTARWLGWGKLSVDRWGSLGVVRGVSRPPWQPTGEHPALNALNKQRAAYAAGAKRLPAEIAALRLGPAWREAIADPDRERAFKAMEVATLLALRRALRNGSVWIEHSLSFRGREQLFLPEERWTSEAWRHSDLHALPIRTWPALCGAPDYTMMRPRTAFRAFATFRLAACIREALDPMVDAPADRGDPAISTEEIA